MNKEKIVLLSPCAHQGGAERGLLALARRLPDYGYEPRVILLESGPLETWLADVPCDLEVIPAGRGRQLLKTSKTVFHLVNRIRGAKALISNQSKGHIYGGLAASLAGVPEVWWQQQHPSRTVIDMVSATIPSSVVVCSSEASSKAQRQLTPKRRILEVHLGTDVEKLSGFVGKGESIRQRMGWTNIQVVGIVGRLQPWKGQEVFLRAARLVASEFPDVEFALIGGAILGWEGDYPMRLRRLSDELGIAERTHFLGHQAEVYPWFDSLDVVVHASFGEPFDHVLIESMALGKPLVATSKGGSANIVENGVTGLVVEPGNEVQMAQAVLKILKDSRLKEKLGTAARNKATLFSDQRMTEAFVNIIEELSIRRATVNYSSPKNAPVDAVTGDTPSGTAMAGRFTHEVCEHLLDEPPEGYVLDAGAGQGAFSARLKQRGYRVGALGIAPNQFAMSQNIPFVACDLEVGIPFASASLAGIVAIEVLEHLEAPLVLFREASRCLREGGFFLLSTPNVLNMSSKLSFVLRDYMVHFNDKDFSSNGHISPLSLREVKRMASISGFEVEEVTYNVGKLPIPKIRHLLPLTADLFRTKLWGEILIVKLRRTSKEVVNRQRG